jgi:serine protease AprX
MRKFAVLGGSCLLACTISAATLPESSRPPPDPSAARPGRLADRDNDRISDGLQASLAAARPGDLFRVVVTHDGPGNAATARQAVGPFALHREFKIINGFAATMTAAQIRALTQRAGVFRIEEDASVSIKLDAARPDFGVDAARTSFGVSGTGVRACIVDTGVDPNHEQLNTRLIPFYDAVNGATLAYDDQGHGTHVASIAFGDGTGGSAADRYRGVAPGVAIHAAKVLNASGSGSESQVIDGIEWCVAQGVHIISMSLGTAQGSDGNDALSQAANAAVASGTIVVAAAGNSGDEPGTVGAPGAAAQVITVGACADRSAPAGSPNHSDGIYLAPFSSRGPTLDNRIKPDICAPGHSITAAKSGTINAYATFSGTSMATPFVAGTIALGLQAGPMTPTQVRQNLESTAQDRGPVGKDNDWGAGLLDGYAFVAKSKSVASYEPTVFPAYQRVSASVANNGLWTYSFPIAPTDLGVPIGAAITIDGQPKCTLFLLGICFGEQWDPDLEARLMDPNGVVLAESTCLADDECGGMGRQETLHAMPTVVGTYTIQVFPAGDSGNQGKGGSFFLDVSTGPLATVASNPAVHVGAMSPASTAVKNGWRAIITITLHDANHAAFQPAATVSGTWSDGFSGTSSCTTTNGQCSVTSGNISKRRASTTFTVTNVISPVTYQPGSNDASSATASRP